MGLDQGDNGSDQRFLCKLVQSTEFCGETKLRTELFWVITQRVVVICYRSLGTTHLFRPQGPRIEKPNITQETKISHHPVFNTRIEHR